MFLCSPLWLIRLPCLSWARACAAAIAATAAATPAMMRFRAAGHPPPEIDISSPCEDARGGSRRPDCSERVLVCLASRSEFPPHMRCPAVPDSSQPAQMDGQVTALAHAPSESGSQGKMRQVAAGRPVKRFGSEPYP